MKTGRPARIARPPLAILALASAVLQALPAAAQLPLSKAVVQVSATVPTTPEYSAGAFANSASAGAAIVTQPGLAPAPGRFTVALVDALRGNTPVTATAPVAVRYSVGGSAMAGVDYFALPGLVTIPAGASSAEIFVFGVQDGLFEGNETVTVTLSDAIPGGTLGSLGRSATVTVVDGDNRVSIAATTPAADEAGAKAGAFTLTREGPTNSSRDVLYSVSGSATAGADYAALPGTATIRIGATSAAIPVTPLPDPLSDDNESVIVTLRPGPGYAVGTPSTATVTVRDLTVAFDKVTTTSQGATKALPDAGATIAKATGKSADFLFTRTGDPSAPLVVPLVVSGSAVSGIDFDLAGSPTALSSGPPPVAFAAGSTTASVRVSAKSDAGPAGTSKTVTLALAGGKTYAVSSRRGATLTLDPNLPLAVTSLVLGSAAIPSGASTTATVTLDGEAFGAGANVALSSSSPAAVVPASVTVPPGRSSATFDVQAATVSLETPVTIRAGLGQVTGPQAAVLTVRVPAVASVDFTPPTVPGGSPTTGIVTMTAPAAGKALPGTSGTTVALSVQVAPVSANLGPSSPPPGASPVTIPASVTILPGQTSATFDVATVPVAKDSVATVTASIGAVSKSGALTVKGPSVASLSVAPLAISGGGTATATYSLSIPAPAPGVTIQLKSDPPLLLNGSALNATSALGAGDTAGSFTVATNTVFVPTTVKVFATLNGVTKDATFTVNPPAVTSLAFAPAVVVAGGRSLGTVTLEAPAPGPFLAVPLSSDSVAASVPGSVRIASGQKSATFLVSAAQVGSDVTARITAGPPGAQRPAELVISPPATIASLSLSPATVTGGVEIVTGTVTLSGPVPGSVSTSQTPTTPATPATLTDGSSNTIVISEGSAPPSIVIGGNALVQLVREASDGGVRQIGLPTPPALNAAGDLVIPLVGGQTTATFRLGALATASDQVIPVTATAAGLGVSGSANATLTDLAPVFQSLSVTPSPVLGGSPVTASLTFSGPLPLSPVTATVASSSPAAKPPASVQLLSLKRSFVVPTTLVPADTPVTVVVTVGGVTKSATFTVTSQAAGQPPTN